MKAPDFAYVRPASLEAALALLAEHGEDAVPLAGGQSLVTALNMRLSAPGLLVDLNAIPELAGVSEADGVVRIGAMTRHRDVGTAALVRERLPLLAAALPHIAHPAIRNRGTIGGIGRAGRSRLRVARLLRRRRHHRGRGAGRRAGSIAADALLPRPVQTALEPGEIVTAVRRFRSGADTVWGFDERRAAHGDYALVGLAAHARPGAGGLSDLRLAFFGVGRPPAGSWAAAARGRPRGRRPRAAQGGPGRRTRPRTTPTRQAAARLHLARVVLGRVAGRMRDGSAQAGGPMASESPDREPVAFTLNGEAVRRMSRPGCISPTCCAKTSASPACISAASTACAAPARSWSTAGRCGPA